MDIIVGMLTVHIGMLTLHIGIANIFSDYF